MTVKERIIKFVKYKNISVRSFEETIGVSYGYVSSIRVSIQPDKIKSIALHYPDLNTEWLLTGEGGMLKEEESKALANTSDNNIVDFLKSEIEELKEEVKTLREEKEKIYREKEKMHSELGYLKGLLEGRISTDKREII